MSSLIQHRHKVNELRARYLIIQEEVERLRLRKQKLDAGLRNAEEAADIARTIAQDVQQRTFSGLSALVTSCLEAVFNEPYQFKIRFEVERGKTVARLELYRGGQIYKNPLQQVGGGVVDVAAFALRLVALLISRPRLRRILILDEPFRFVAKDLHPKLHDLVCRLSEELDVQFIIITHEEDFQTGKVIELLP